MFPITHTGIEEPSRYHILPSDEEIDSKLKLIMSQMRPQKVIPSEELGEDANTTTTNQEKSKVLRPGSRYTCYRSEAELPNDARIFFQTSAKLVGISLNSLISVVFKTETRIRQWQEDRRRAEYHDQKFNDAIYISGEEDGFLTEDKD